jgi:hypothetical protein
MSSKLQKILVLVAIGVAAAVVIGLLGARGGSSGSGSTDAQAQAQEQAQTEQAFCSSLASLRSATGTLTDLDPQKASKSDYQQALAAVQSNWQLVNAQAKALKNTSIDSLEQAWTEFDSAVNSVPSGASVSESLQAISSQAKALIAATESSGLGC